jgi:RimJ/RimL family protein N-acetyltransferase
MIVFVPDPLLRDLPPCFATPRLQARALQPGDGPALYEAVAESRVQVYPFLRLGLDVIVPADAEALCREAWAAFQRREQFRFGLWTAPDSRLVGMISLHYGDWSVPRFEVGCWVRASQARRGYATEAARGIIDYGFVELGLARLEIRFDHRNAASQRLAERLGFTPEARLRAHHRALDGVLVDEVVYGLLRDEWAGGEQC